jgi:hypothetical protein
MVLDIIKSYTKTNLRDLNSRIMAIIGVDEDFKTKVIAPPPPA